MKAALGLRPARALTRGLRKISEDGRRAGAEATRTTAKSAAGEAARTLTDASEAPLSLEDEIKHYKPRGFETILFRQLPRPRLTERSASDLTIDEAKKYAEQAARFYDFDFSLFAHGDFFYEEVEEEFLNNALGAEAVSVDRRFLDVMTLFRRTLNNNTRVMLLSWMPLLFTITMAVGGFFASRSESSSWFDGGGLLGPLAQFAVITSSFAIIGFFVASFLFSWPFKVVQQRNLMNLDNYITSKFARVNHNFQVAKRRALNVERDKRMGQRDDLKKEAGAWTLSYHWFAMRLFLCELMIRNKFYQVRRNTTLYWAGGVAMSAAALLILGMLAWSQGLDPLRLTVFAGVGAGLLIALSSVFRRVSPMMFRVVEAHEWSRFHLVNLHATISDHVGEDKVQIVTFRDRNRFE